MVIFQTSEKRSFENCGVLPPSNPAATKIDHIHEDGARCVGEKDFFSIGSSAAFLGNPIAKAHKITI
ncbi:hypothetical protein [Rhizobium ruizarguesonis]|uniref:hypothetical protein n=1 Tax=Rhizobium ruizarguesonis TaxID=2081791 RepID=UPI0013C197AE|nr:hypothetical protein [Rhizobium ruizarguesonis]NEI99876.1 hypothetical protein [Rhizobium ruizarguesonis]NEJ34748.1 hypothetical protein [Rhizobium ruizarguesonis]